MLVTIDNVLTADELATLRGWLAQAPWARSISAGTQAAQVKMNEQLPDGTAGLNEMRTLVMRALNRSQLLISAALPLKILPPNFNRYQGDSNHYGFHTDNAMRPLPDGSYLRTDISATLFLSDPDSYEGGVLTVDDTFGRHGVKLPAGSLVLYPSSSIHEVSPVTAGERLGCYMFMQSMVRDPEQRRLLFEMDMALIRLRQKHGEEQELVTLTGMYHNLLRRWAEC